MNFSRPVLIGLCLLPAIASAEDAPTTAPTTIPTTLPAGKVEAVPPGLIRVTDGQFSSFCLPVDEPWVKPTLASVQLEQQPSTRPADILAKVLSNKNAVADGMSQDLGIDASAITKYIDEQLTPQLDQLNQYHRPAVFLTLTEQKLVALINADWKHPRISYNRLMDQIRFDDRMFLPGESVMDEVLMLAVYDPTDDVKTRAKKLHDAMSKFATDMAFSAAARGRVLTQQGIAQLVDQLAFKSLNLQDNESWLQMGVSNYMAAQYASRFTGEDPKQMLADMTYERPNTVPSADSIDLLNLPDLRQLLPQYQLANIAAARRKSTLAIAKLVEKAGPGAIHKALTAVRKNPPKNAEAMVGLITGATDVDLTADLRTKH